MRLPEEKCESSRDYIPICLADEEDKDTIVPAEPWPEFRPDTEIVYNESEPWGWFAILTGVGAGRGGRGCPHFMHDYRRMIIYLQLILR